MKRNFAVILALILIIGNICYSDMNSAKRPEGIEPDVVKVAEAVTESAAVAEVLIIKDFTPWTSPGNEEALTDLGKTYDVINTDDIATTDLSIYKIVIVASDQNTATYDALIANAGDLASYVSGRGILLAHACDLGWHLGHWSSSWLPGGVDHVDDPNNNLSIVDATSPIVNGISDADLDNWFWSTHGYFTGLVAGTNIVMGTTDDPTGQPTYIEYRHGSGWVLATMQTMEWPWTSTQGTEQLLLNEILYAQTLSIEVEIDIKPGSCPNPFNFKPNSKQQSNVPVAIVGSAEFDVTTIDPESTICLTGPGGTACAVKSELLDPTEPDAPGPEEDPCYDCFNADTAPLNCDLIDATDPQNPVPGTDGVLDSYCGDGIPDLVLYFDTAELAAAIGEADRDDCVLLTLTGETLAGILIEGSDSVVIKTKIKD